MPFVIGTAGHIDHGKTALVKALTGQDTDRLKEEKERGISIDLGFAYLDLPDGTRAGVVDVPGHERFIRNMLAGAHGLDLILFTVAADDGVMPQSEEHFEIVHLLGVTRAIFVITKADLASDGRCQEVAEEIGVLAEGTPLERSPIVACSSITGLGLQALRTHIAEALHAAIPRSSRGFFRLPVDRAFVLRGHGLVVTGTALDGKVSVGDQVRCLPADQTFRVRSVQVHGDAVEAARAGQRAALNLTGHEKPSIERGDVVCALAVTRTTTRFDAWFEVRTSGRTAVATHQRVRVHIGTAERLATCVVLGTDTRIEPGSRGYCQLVLKEPVLALRGDRFIVRDETARRTLGGGTVLHPLAAKHKKTDLLADELRVLRDGSLAEVLEMLLREDASFALPFEPLHELANAPEDEVRSALASGSIRTFDLDGERVYATEAKWRDVVARAIAMLRSFHAVHPLVPGMEMETVRDTLPFEIPPRLFRALIDELVAEGTMAREGNLIRLPSHTVQLRDDEQRLVERITSLLGSVPFSPPDLKQLETDTGVSKVRLTDVLRVLERQEQVVRVAADLYFLTSAVEVIKAELRRHLPPAGDITPTLFRSLFGTTRKYTIPLLEYLDRVGVTIRRGEMRRLR
jgi:selenocysteine-specific elongation factor